jgi:hypothetical protein
MSIIFNFVKLLSPKCNGSWVVSIKQDVSFKFQPPVMFVFLFSAKVVLLKVVHPQKIYQHTKFHGPTFTGKTFASTSEVWTSAIFEWRYGVINYGVKVTFNGRASLLNSIKIYHFVQKLIGGQTDTDKMVTSLVYIFPLGSKVGYNKSTGVSKLPSSIYWTSGFIFGRSLVQVSAQKAAVLTEVCRGFPQSLQANARRVL